MKKKYLLTLTLLFFFINTISFGQAIGDLAFVGFNADGDRDFAIVTLVDIPAVSTIYFTDDETDGIIPGGGITVSGLVGSEGALTWSTGANIIKAGTIVVFTDTDSSGNPSFGVSIGTIIRSGSFTISGSKDGLIAFYGTNATTPTTYITALQIGNDNAHLGPFDVDGITLTNTGLVIGTTIAIIDNVASPDGGVYQGSRSDQASYASYKTQLTDKTNWSTTASTGDGETYLNFSTEAFILSGATTTWTGGFNTVWNLAGNWDNGIPTSDSNVIIPNVANDPIISDPSATGNVTLNSGASLTINNTLTNKGITTLNSTSSLIVSGGSISGNISYKRNLAIASNGWHLVSSPLEGETITNYNAKNSLLAGGTGTNIALATYDNAYGGAFPWVYETTASTGGFTSGKGYQTKLAAAGDVVFTGTMPTADVSIGITIGATTPYNLIGNPFPSYVDGNTFLNDNTTKLVTKTMWYWDEATNAYLTKNLASTFKISPAQGFFVECGTAGNVTFTEASLSHETTDTFLRTTNNRPEIKIMMSDQTTTKYSNIYYINGTTTGFDNGYDGEMFNGGDNSFAVYSHLVSGSQGKNYQIQSLPDSNYENMIIPLGVNATSGTEITFTADIANLPAGIDVYLENRTANTFTKLSNNGNYTITLNTDSNGIGQFYLRTTSSALGVENVILDNVSIYKTGNTTLRIAGLQPGSTSLKLVTILGKQVLAKSFTTNGVSDVTLPKLTTGIYIVQLQTKNGKLNKKIVIE